MNNKTLTDHEQVIKQLLSDVRPLGQGNGLINQAEGRVYVPQNDLDIGASLKYIA